MFLVVASPSLKVCCPFPKLTILRGSFVQNSKCFQGESWHYKVMVKILRTSVSFGRKKFHSRKVFVITKFVVKKVI